MRLLDTESLVVIGVRGSVRQRAGPGNINARESIIAICAFKFDVLVNVVPQGRCDGFPVSSYQFLILGASGSVSETLLLPHVTEVAACDSVVPEASLICVRADLVLAVPALAVVGAVNEIASHSRFLSTRLFGLRAHG